MKKVYLISFLVLLIPLLAVSASAELLISQPNAIYMLGSPIDVSVSIVELNSVSGLLQLSLVCPMKSTVFYADTIQVDSGTAFEIKKSIIPVDILGDCYIGASFLSESVTTNRFQISDKINLAIELSNKYLKPGEQLQIKGKAVREDGKLVSGFAEITISSVLKQTVSISNGAFNINVNIPENAKPAEYKIEIFAYEKYNDIRTNKNTYSETFYISAIPSDIEIALNNDSFIPSSKLALKPVLLDQSGNEMAAEVRLEINDSKNKNFVYENIAANEIKEYTLPANASAGEWKIKIDAFGISDKRIIYVEEYESASVNIEGDILTVVNTGNVAYKKPITVSFIRNGEEVTETKRVSLGIGESQEFQLKAEDGVYDVEALDQKFSGISLTGHATSLVSVGGTKHSIFLQYPFISFVVFIILILFIVFISRPKADFDYIESKGLASKGEGTGYIVASSAMPISGKDAGKSEDALKKIFSNYLDNSLVEKIVQGSVISNRQEISVMLISLKNLPSLMKLENFQDLMNKYFKIITNAVYGNRGVISHIAGSDLIAVFNAPRSQEGHESAAVRSAVKISDGLASYSELVYGIGINEGEAAVGLNGKVLRFMPSKNLTQITQKLKEKSKNEILITKNMNDVIRETFKTQRYGIIDTGAHGVEVFEVLKGGKAYSSSETDYNKSSALADMIAKIKKNEELREAEKRLKGE